MGVSKEFTKWPIELLDYQWDWTKVLRADEVISSVLGITAPDGVSIASYNHTDKTVTAWVFGGTMNSDCSIVCQIRTNQGREPAREIIMHIGNR